MLSIKAFVSVLLSIVASVQAYANPGACSGSCGVHDPALIRRDSDGTYFRFGTSGGIPIATAPSISGPWTYKGVALASGSSISNAGSDDIWAPDVTKFGNYYFMYYAVSSFGSQNSAIGLAVSSTMDVGSWTDYGSTGLSSSSSKPYNAIDPNFFKVSDGNYYLNFGSFWGDLYQVKLDSTAKKVSGSSYQIAYTSSGSHAEEGTTMFWHSPYYYLFYSAGQCCGLDTSPPASGGEYKIMVCRSSSATGGFVDASGKACTAGGGTVVLQSHGNIYAPGGQGVYNDPSLGPVLYYHYMDKSKSVSDGSALFGWNVITWSNGWPTV